MARGRIELDWRAGVVLGLLATVLLLFAGVKLDRSRAVGDDVQSLPAPTAAAEPPVLLAIGDSFTSGTGDDDGYGFACRAAALLKWTCAKDGEGGTGYVANGQVNSKDFEPFAGRLDKDRQYRPDVIVVAGGLNDANALADQFTSAARDYLAALHKAYPGVPLLVLGPFSTAAELPENLAAVRDALAAISQEGGYTFIDPAAEHWFDASQQRPDGHPTTEGHKALAQHLAEHLSQVGVAAS